MMAIRVKRFKLILLIVLLPFVSLAQSKQSLEQRRVELQKQINQTNKLLNQTKNKEQGELDRLRLLETKTSQLEQIISDIRAEIRALSFKIQKNEAKIHDQEIELAQLKKSFANNVKIAYKEKKSQNTWMLLLSSTSVNEAFRKLNYLKKWNEYRSNQAEQIKLTLAALDQNRQELLSDRKEKDALLDDQKNQIAQLNKNKQEIKGAIESLKKDKTKYLARLKKNRQEAQALENQIKRIIEEEMAAKRREEAARAAAKNKENAKSASSEKVNTDAVDKNNTRTTRFKNAPEHERLSNNFTQNKGKFPWPVSQGVIINSLGEYGDEVLPGIKKDRDGIDIRTPLNESVSAIFDGEVRSITTIPGYNKVVIISHGDYFTVYGKLQDILVSPGEKVHEGQAIGHAEVKDNQSEVHIQFWKGQTRLDPKQWLKKQ